MKKGFIFFMTILILSCSSEVDKKIEIAKKEVSEKSNKLTENQVKIFLEKGKANYEEFPEVSKIYFEKIAGRSLEAKRYLAYYERDYKKNQEKYKSMLLELSSMNDSEAMIDLGNLYIDTEEYEEAEKWCKIAQKENYYEAMNCLGRIYSSKEEYDKAEEIFIKILKDRNDDNVMYNLANTYVRKKDYKKAEKYYLKAIENGADNSAYNNLGYLYYYKLNNLEKGEEYFLKAIEMNKRDTNPMENLANLYFSVGKDKEVEKLLLKVVELEENEEHLNNLLKFYNEIGENRKAQRIEKRLEKIKKK